MRGSGRLVFRAPVHYFGLRRACEVDSWVPWVGLVVTAALTLFATLNLALRAPSRVRIAEQFEAAGRVDSLEAFAVARPQYVLCTAVLRSAATLALLFIALDQAGVGGATTITPDTVVACAVTLALVLIFGVAIPNAWAKYAGEVLIVRVLPLLCVVRFVCYPLIILLELFDPLVRRLAGVPVRDTASYADEFEQQILDVVSEGERHGAVGETEKEMIESVIELADTRVDQIMTPRTEVVALPKDADLNTVLETIRVKGHSRIPVYDETIDTIMGILYAKDLLQHRGDEPLNLAAIMRRGLFIPESKLVRDLLREFQEQKVHIAIVLDEYGGTAGLVTIEDILEELVGEIADEHDKTAPAKLRRIDESTVDVDARMRIDDLNDELDIELPEDEDFETIGGFVFSRMGKIPKAGERFAHDNIAIQVVGAEARRITRVRLTIARESEAREDPA